jgi:type IV pilus assembly protein PilM
MKQPLFYHNQPLFGLDIGFNNMKVMQIDTTGKTQKVLGYGVTNFSEGAITEGVITDLAAVAQAAMDLFKNQIIGNISTHRVAVAIPAVRTFNRNLVLPKLAHKDLADAVLAEAEQYIPIPNDDLYIDYSVVSETAEDMELLMVAVPRKIIDSYLDLLSILNLEPIAFETTIAASSRLFVQSEKTDVPTILMDFGSISSDITIYDKKMVVTGTVTGGGDSFTNAIATTLGVTRQEAHIIKAKYGLGPSKKQIEITATLEPLLAQTTKEVRRMIRYFEERSEKGKQIAQIVTLGGGANMVGLSDYLTNALRLPVRTCNPWNSLEFNKVDPPIETQKTLYATVAGLGLITPKELFS